jgi:hypothetical protein
MSIPSRKCSYQKEIRPIEFGVHLSTLLVNEVFTFLISVPHSKTQRKKKVTHSGLLEVRQWKSQRIQKLGREGSQM